MAKNKTCPDCGEILSSDAPEGLCPKCLLRSDIFAKDTQAIPQTSSLESERIQYFGDYELDQEIARGGMGVVYLARQMTLNRRVAIKMILAGHLADEKTVKRFYAEAEAAANLKHPNIVSIHEVGVHNGQHYFSMDFIEGENLTERANGKPLAAKEAARIVKTIAEAIQYAHQRGVLHRDLKPSNVLIDQEGRPHVTDFGLAKLMNSDSMLTQSGELMGTPSYMPPEQASGRQDQVGPHSDVYSLGAILYELLTGKPPFQSSSSMDTLLQLMEVEPVPPKRRNENIPTDLDTICLKCLEKSPLHRYQSAGELAEELGRFLRQEPIHARPAGVVRKMVVWARRRPGQLAATVALIFSSLVGGVYYLIQENAFLRAMQTTPGLSRESGSRVETLETWNLFTPWVFYMGLFFAVWLMKRIRGTLRRSPGDGLSVQPFYPIGTRVRTLTACIGFLATLFSLVYVMKLIEAYVWERNFHFHEVFLMYGTSWFGLWLLVIVVADYRRSLFGTPQRTLTSKQKDEIEHALFQHDLREAIGLYQQAFADASRAEASAFVIQRSTDMYKQRPKEFAALPRLWDLNWQYMALCALIEVPIVVVFWFVLRPSNPVGFFVGLAIGAAFIFGFTAIVGRLLHSGRRRLAIVGLTSMLIIGALAFNTGSSEVLGPLMYLGIFCGAALMSSASKPKRRRRSEAPKVSGTHPV